MLVYTEDAGWAVTAGIPMKFGTAHGKSALEVGGAKCNGAYGRKGVTPPPQTFGTSKQKIITPTDLLRSIHNFNPLLFIARTNIYRMVVKAKFCSHSIQC